MKKKEEEEEEEKEKGKLNTGIIGITLGALFFSPKNHGTQKLIWDGLDINAKTETIRLLEENLGEYHHDLYQEKIF